MGKMKKRSKIALTVVIVIALGFGGLLALGYYEEKVGYDTVSKDIGKGVTVIQTTGGALASISDSTISNISNSVKPVVPKNETKPLVDSPIFQPAVTVKPNSNSKPTITYYNCKLTSSYNTMQTYVDCNQNYGYDTKLEFYLKTPEQWRDLVGSGYDLGTNDRMLFGTADKIVHYPDNSFDIVIHDQVSSKTYHTTYWELPQ